VIINTSYQSALKKHDMIENCFYKIAFFEAINVHRLFFKMHRFCTALVLYQNLSGLPKTISFRWSFSFCQFSSYTLYSTYTIRIFLSQDVIYLYQKRKDDINEGNIS